MPDPRRLLAIALAFGLGACGTSQDSQPRVHPEWKIEKGADGKEYRVVKQPPYTVYYDLSNKVQKIEYDSNGDGKPDYIAHHDGKEKAHLLEIDSDFDGHIDRWEYYDQQGNLVKVGTAYGGAPGENRWVYLDDKGLPSRIEYDTDNDKRVDRVEIFEHGRLVRVEADADRDGRIDRWQDWSSGGLTSEELDTDGDGKPDRRLRYDERGEVVSIEPR